MTAYPDFGHDLACLTDLDVGQSEVSGLTCLAQALVRRLQCPIGGMIGDPDYGFFIIGEVDDDVTSADIARIASSVDREFAKDERVVSSRTTASFAAGSLTVASTVLTSAGPFKLVLGISSIIQILAGTTPSIANTIVSSIAIGSPAPVIAPSPNPGGDLLVRFPITTAASQSSATALPAGSIVLRCMLDMASSDLVSPVAFSAGATVAIGRTGSASLLAAPGDFDATTAGNVYDALDPVAWGASALPVLVTVAGSPAAGAGTVVIEYLPPSAIGN